MKLTEYLRRRANEARWLHLKGYENGDPETNGEFLTLELLRSYFVHFVDIGANRGDFSRKIKDMHESCRVTAFEPNPGLHSRIRACLDQDRGDRLFGCALSDKSGKARFFVFASNDSVSSLSRRTEMNPKFRRGTTEIEVDVATLDDFIERFEENADASDAGILLKVDAEGHEAHILRGGRRLFAVHRPLFILFEYSFGWVETESLFRDTYHDLNEQDFSVWRLTPLGLELVPFYRRSMDDTLYCNYLAVKNFDMLKRFDSVAVKTPYTETRFIPFAQPE